MMDQAKVVEVINSVVNTTKPITYTVNFTAEHVLVVLGPVHPSHLDSLRDVMAAQLNDGWIEDKMLAAEIGAGLIIGRPGQIELFKQRLKNS